MLLEYIGWSEAAELIISAIEKNFKSGIFTADLAFGKRAYSTSGFSNQILSIIWLFFAQKWKLMIENNMKEIFWKYCE